MKTKEQLSLFEEDKSLFEEDESFTPEGRGFSFEVQNLISELFKKHPEYKVREMSTIIGHIVSQEGARQILARRKII